MYACKQDRLSNPFVTARSRASPCLFLGYVNRVESPLNICSSLCIWQEKPYSDHWCFNRNARDARGWSWWETRRTAASASLIQHHHPLKMMLHTFIMFILCVWSQRWWFEMVRVVSVLGLVMFSIALLILSLISYVSIKKDFIFTAPKYPNAGGPRMYMFHAGFRYVCTFLYMRLLFMSSWVSCISDGKHVLIRMV